VQPVWILALGIATAFAYLLWRARRRWLERSRAAEERYAAFIAQAPAAAPPPLAAAAIADPAALTQQKLLVEAAMKAGEAGEPALAIQLYARLLARYPQTTFAGQARKAVERQKERLAKS
jgi:hypothetical protein